MFIAAIKTKSMTELRTTPHTEQQDISRDHELELARTVKIMQRLHAAEIFETPEKSKVFLDSLDYDGFKKYISLVNGVERNIPTTERGKASNSHVMSEGGLMGTEVTYRPPHQNFRDKLLKMAFEKAQSLDDPEMAGLTLGLSINAIHYFADGNGRTARMAYALLAEGYDGSPEAQERYSSLLENTKGREVVNPNPTISGIDRAIRSEMFSGVMEKRWNGAEAFGGKPPTSVYGGYGDAFAGEYSPEGLALADDIVDDIVEDRQKVEEHILRRMLYETLESGGMTMISLMATFETERIKEFVKTSSDGSRTFVMGDEFMPTLSRDEIKEWWNNSERAIAAYVKKLIDVADREDAVEIAACYNGEIARSASPKETAPPAARI
mgnify:CR=1 FL=1